MLPVRKLQDLAWTAKGDLWEVACVWGVYARMQHCKYELCLSCHFSSHSSCRVVCSEWLSGQLPCYDILVAFW